MLRRPQKTSKVREHGPLAADVMEGDDVGMGERGDRAPETSIAGAIDLAHPAAAEGTENFVRAAEADDAALPCGFRLWPEGSGENG